MYFNVSRSVIIDINYVQGIVMIQGLLYKVWIQDEFPKLVRNMDEETILNFENCETQELASEKKDAETMTSNEYVEGGANEMLWEKCDEISNVISTTNDTIFSLSNRLLETENRMNTAENENILIEKKFDEKVSIFMETTLNEYTEK